MGNTCHCGADASEEFHTDAMYGIEDTHVAESFQYHSDKLKEYEVKLNYSDKFYRAVCGPMHLF